MVSHPRRRRSRPARDPVRAHSAASGVESGAPLGTGLTQRCGTHGSAPASATRDSAPDTRTGEDAPASRRRASARSSHNCGSWPRLAPGEALALRWEAVDLDAGVLSVRHTLDWKGGDPVARRSLAAESDRLEVQLNATTDDATRRRLQQSLAETRQKLQAVRGSVHFAEPKTARSRRTITLPEVVATALRKHRIRLLEERLVTGSRWRESGLVFTTPIGTPIGTHSLHRTFKTILRGAGLPDIRYHDLRHTAASLLLAQGVDPRTIMETLGHSQIGLTLNTYAHVVPALQRKAAAKMDEILTR